MTGILFLTLLSGGDKVFEERYPIEILAFDQWNGVETLPEVFVAFVTPNQPAISGVIHTASAFLV